MVPPVCVEHPERITSILVTPIWVQVTFEEGGKEYLFEHHYPDHSEYEYFQYLYDLKKDGTALFEVGGKTIYAASHTGEECDYCWLQDGECFELARPARRARQPGRQDAGETFGSCAMRASWY